MAPRSPLPQQHGLDAAWVRSPSAAEASAAGWVTMRDWLNSRLPAKALVDQRLAAGEYMDDAGRPWDPDAPFTPYSFVWFHRPLEPEPELPFDLPVIYRDRNIVVVDKPHFMATIPRGSHVTQTALIRLRVALDLPELTPAHRLDRLTAGVLVFTTRREVRGAYAGVFQDRGAVKTYDALAPYDASLEFPRRVACRIEKPRDSIQALVVPGEVNAITDIEVAEVRGSVAHFRLSPITGKTHQLRVHMASLGLALLNDPLYPSIVPVKTDDWDKPLQLIARSLEFTDPYDGTARRYVSEQALRWPSASA